MKTGVTQSTPYTNTFLDSSWGNPCARSTPTRTKICWPFNSISSSGVSFSASSKEMVQPWSANNPTCIEKDVEEVEEVEEVKEVKKLKK